MTVNDLAQQRLVSSHTLPVDHDALVSAVQCCATTAAGAAHPIEVLDVLVLDDAPRQSHTVAVLAEEYDVAQHTLLFQTYDVDTATLVASEHR